MVNWLPATIRVPYRLDRLCKLMNMLNGPEYNDDIFYDQIDSLVVWDLPASLDQKTV